MNSVAKAAISVGVVVGVALVGINLLPSTDGIGRGGPTASSSSSLSPSQPSNQPPSPPPSPRATLAAGFPPAGELAIGQHTMTLEGVPLRFTVPVSGWFSNGSFGIDRSTGVGPEGAGFIFWTDTPVGVYADPCANVERPPVGASAADLAAAVASVTGTELVSGPTDVSVGGYPAKLVVLRVPDDVGCGPGQFYLWYASTVGFARYATQLGSTIRVWIVDVGGKIVWIDGETYKGAGPEPGQEIQQIIDSIQFE